MSLLVLRRALAAATSIVLLAASADAGAAIFRAYLSSTGSDTNDCTRPTPCRLLPAALNAVSDGGEIWILDSANFNTATLSIGKSVSILAIPGAVGSVVATNGPAISITAAGLTVSLRNLVIVPLPAASATDGVNMTGASTLTIENSLIANLPAGNGVFVTGTGKVAITNTIIRNNSNFAVRLDNGATAEISGTQMLMNGQGGVFAESTAAATTRASVSDSIIAGGVEGVVAYTTNGAGIANITVTRCTIQGASFVALHSENLTGTPVIAVSNSTITHNNAAWSQNFGGVIRTLGNNHIADNVNASIGVLTPAALQ
jgi:hypothetical protein